MDVSFNKPIPEKEDPKPLIGLRTRRYNAQPAYGQCVLERIPVKSAIHLTGESLEDVRWKIVKLGSKEYPSAAGRIPFSFKVGDEVLLDLHTKGGSLGGDPERLLTMMNYVIARVPPGGDDG